MSVLALNCHILYLPLPIFFLTVSLWEFNRLLNLNWTFYASAVFTLTLMKVIMQRSSGCQKGIKDSERGKFGITVNSDIKHALYFFMDSLTTSTIIDHFIIKKCLLCCLYRILVSKYYNDKTIGKNLSFFWDLLK